MRRRQRLNMLASMILSKGTPMLLAGDEFGNSQQGNNNAYAQDNETGWLDWRGLDSDPDFFLQVQGLLRLRRMLPHLASENYLHGIGQNDAGWHDIEWLNPAGTRVKLHQWHNDRALTLLLPEMDDPRPAGESHTEGGLVAVAIMLNAANISLDFILPDMPEAGAWHLVFYSAGSLPSGTAPKSWSLPPRSIACAVCKRVAC
jgi:isoamylase